VLGKVHRDRVDLRLFGIVPRRDRADDREQEWTPLERQRRRVKDRVEQGQERLSSSPHSVGTLTGKKKNLAHIDPLIKPKQQNVSDPARPKEKVGGVLTNQTTYRRHQA
jgi:hypothetical protein